MPFEDQFEQLKDYLFSLKERIQGSGLYINTSEKFLSLSPSMQKLIVVALVLLVAFVLLSKPLADFKESNENLTLFKKRSQITQDIIQLSKKATGTKPKNYSLMELESLLVGQYYKSPSLKILSEQSSLQPVNVSNLPDIPGAQIQSYALKNTNLNSEQFLNLLYSLQKLNKSIYLNSAELKASQDKENYFNSEIRLTNLSVPELRGLLPQSGSMDSGGGRGNVGARGARGSSGPRKRRR